MEDKICGHEQAKKLAYAGVGCCSKFSWVEHEGKMALMETKDIGECDACYPALTLDECTLIIKKCHQKVSWKKDKDILHIDIAGIVSLKMDKTEEEKKIETDCEIVIVSILHLLQCEEIDCDYVNAVLRKHNGHCHEEHEKDHDDKDHHPHPHPDKCCEELKEQIGCLRTFIGDLFCGLRELIEKEFAEVKHELHEVKEELREVKKELGEVKEELGIVRHEVRELRKEIFELRNCVKDLKELIEHCCKHEHCKHHHKKHHDKCKKVVVVVA